MIKKITLVINIIVITIFLYSGICSANGAQPVRVLSEFTITIIKIEVSYNGGASYSHTLYEDENGVAVDLISSAANSALYSFTAAGGLPYGTINRIRITIKNQLSFTGYSDQGEGEDPRYWYHATTQSIDYKTLLTTTASTSNTVPTPGKITVTGLTTAGSSVELVANYAVGNEAISAIYIGFRTSSCLSGDFIGGNEHVYNAPLGSYCSGAKE